MNFLLPTNEHHSGNTSSEFQITVSNLLSYKDPISNKFILLFCVCLPMHVQTRIPQSSYSGQRTTPSTMVSRDWTQIIWLARPILSHPTSLEMFFLQNFKILRSNYVHEVIGTPKQVRCINNGTYTHTWKQHGWKWKASGEQHLNSQLEAPAC